MSKVIRVCFGFALPRSVICGQAELAPLSQPIRSKTRKTNRELHARIFPRFMPSHVIASNSDWFFALFASVVIGQSNCFGFDFTTHNTLLMFSSK